MGNFFIGIGPFLSSIGALILLMYFCVPDSYQLFAGYITHHVRPAQLNIEMFTSSLFSAVVLFESLFTIENALNPLFWLFLFLALCISTHIALSKEDIRGAVSGMSALFVFLFCLHAFSSIFNIDIIGTASYYHAYIIAFASSALLFSFITLCICFVLYILKNQFNT
ncbi:hypothetical protein [Domibacillus epiphyticus]|nr:hypothetical protein [Domibacillus epiphyticus]